jgi:hypothetical protein
MVPNKYIRICSNAYTQNRKHEANYLIIKRRGKENRKKRNMAEKKRKYKERVIWAIGVVLFRSVFKTKLEQKE